MTERKPPGVSFESWVDKQIREATERGDFDNLPGAGKPLPGLGRPYEEQWWLKNYLRREGLSTGPLLPTPLRLRKEIERLADTVRDLRSEEEVRAVVATLNLRIVDWLRAPSGPRVRVGQVNAEDVVEQWRAERSAVVIVAAAVVPVDQPTADERRYPWTRIWRRIGRRRGNRG